MNKQELINYFESRPIYIQNNISYYLIGKVEVKVIDGELVTEEVIDNQEVYELYRSLVTKIDELILLPKSEIDNELYTGVIDDYLNSVEYEIIKIALDNVKKLVNSGLLKKEDITLIATAAPYNNNESSFTISDISYYDMRLLKFESSKKIYQLCIDNLPKIISDKLIELGFSQKVTGWVDITIDFLDYFGIAKQLKDIL
jgi:hypothetical protein